MSHFVRSLMLSKKSNKAQTQMEHEEYYHLLGFNWGSTFLQNVGGLISDRISQTRSQQEAGGKHSHSTCRQFLAWLTLRPWRWRQYVPPKTLMEFCRITQCCIPEDSSTLHSHRFEHLKSKWNKLVPSAEHIVNRHRELNCRRQTELQLSQTDRHGGLRF
jgi:hypothetical protein